MDKKLEQKEQKGGLATESKQKVKGPPLVTIPILFQPVLKAMASCLDFPEPIYSIKDFASNNSCVVVQTNAGPNAYTFEGGPSSSLEVSAGKAAELAVIYLMDKYKICVEDINQERKDRNRKCFLLFKHRRKEFECMEEGKPKPMASEAELCAGNSQSKKRVRVNFQEILGAIVAKFNIPVTPIECVQFEDEGYIAWLTMQCKGSSCFDECVIGDKGSTPCEAKQFLAKKAILFLMPRYSFEVEDANYHVLKYSAFAYKLQRDFYLTIKDRVYGFEGDRKPTPCLIDQDSLTPRGEELRISVSKDPPLPPKKRKLKDCFSDIIPAVAVPAELETVVKRRRSD